MNRIEQEYYHELTFYTLQLHDAAFIHQHVVDAFTAQTVNEHTKPIALWFALIGLYLTIEQNYSGKEVQQAHIVISNKTKLFPALDLPTQRGNIRIEDVLSAATGNERNEIIKQWCSSVWQAYESEQEKVRAFAEKVMDNE